MAPNPFRPSFGVTPPLLAGRDNEILAFGDALDAGPGIAQLCRIRVTLVAPERES